jgi:two-component system response regulator HydG
LPTIIVTGFGSIDAAVDAMKRGATDFLTKPIDVDNLLLTLERAIRTAAEAHAIPSVRSQAVREMEDLGIIGHSKVMLELFGLIKRVAPHLSTVLVIGESGSGKELVARALHAKSARSAGPFVAINCASLSEPMLESELFGHERGAFTGADRMKSGVMEVADQGTLFLDEVSEMGLGCQAKLLRALERREFRRVGGTKKIKVDVNVIAACNVDLEERIAEDTFRTDLTTG